VNPERIPSPTPLGQMAPSFVSFYGTGLTIRLTIPGSSTARKPRIALNRDRATANVQRTAAGHTRHGTSTATLWLRTSPHNLYLSWHRSHVRVAVRVSRVLSSVASRVFASRRSVGSRAARRSVHCTRSRRPGRNDLPISGS
jgi:hypothetical protein